MNCKPGDLALWVNRGVLVEVLHQAKTGDIFYSVPDGKLGFRLTLSRVNEAAWVVKILGKPQIHKTTTRSLSYLRLPIYDKSLRPLRDNDGDDETLLWAPVPGQKVPA